MYALCQIFKGATGAESIILIVNYNFKMKHNAINPLNGETIVFDLILKNDVISY